MQGTRDYDGHELCIALLCQCMHFFGTWAYDSKRMLAWRPAGTGHEGEREGRSIEYIGVSGLIICCLLQSYVTRIPSRIRKYLKAERAQGDLPRLLNALAVQQSPKVC